MKGQWGLLFAFIFALIVAIFAVINVDPVTVDYLFGTAQWPLVLVILASALLGALIVGGFGIFRVFRFRRENRALKRENQQLEEKLQKLKEETAIGEGTKKAGTDDQSATAGLEGDSVKEPVDPERASGNESDSTKP